MQRAAMVVLIVAAMSGCRSSQQPINPFIRTTVPPPGTGEGAVVVQSDPYYPGATPTPTPNPQVVTPPPPPATVTAPAQLVAPTATPPTRDLKKNVPGGDLYFHQSSTESPSTRREAGDVSSELAVNAAAPRALKLGGPSDAVEQALALSEEPNPIHTVSFRDYGGRLPGELPLAPGSDEAPRPSTPTRLNYSSQQSVRIEGAPEEDSSVYEVDESSLPIDSSSQSAPERSIDVA